MTSPLAFPCYGPDEPPSPADIEALCATQVHAARALGQLDAALTWCPPDIYPILAARLIRETLISALRQEGHAFTDARFHAWFAGLVPLSDEPLQFALAPRALVTTLLAEMTRSSWAPLADAARGFEKACLALRDLDNHPAVVNGQRTLHPTPHANSPDRQNSLHRRYFLTPFNIRAAALDDGASLRP